jgi:UDP-N-acetylglucosamine--N-acetylmuramyl-(pentapeptide) pyrophosphoryl-undecaprenol N-acetylglucosamine transferase
VLAAAMGIATMVAEQNALPGLLNRVLARFVKAAALSFEEAKLFFKGKGSKVAGNPVREVFHPGADSWHKHQPSDHRWKSGARA